MISIADTGVQAATNSAILSLGSQISATHAAAHAITSAIVPPTNDSASGQAVVQQLGNVSEFGLMLQKGILEIAKVSVLTSVNNVATQAIDAGGAAGAAAISA